ncbi:double-stranded RNA-binding protein 1 isoform X2 [Manihot esculenta]|uniref:Uncharacterized protein n=1 Tax=Manihot esculenta TaxID=3983 RepID=A0ACB7H610_MANES|nr:double-stranded RNA-binding protein 1 isoform X2 [Manihot esculenta]KAG8648022.1 hypothetical protein MANES_09G138400v8 [Manihot esculenta]
MYKTKLQELCHQKAWLLPDYATVKGGPDHDPRFQATVTVNGLSFHSQSPAKSSKQAQNDAAKFAIDHFFSSRSSPPPPPPPPPAAAAAAATPVPSSATADFSSNLSSGGALQFKEQETSQIPEGNGPATIAKNEERFTDMQHLYKNQLQSYAQKRNLTLPVYSCDRVGPPHASRFKCKVTIGGQAYESQEFFPTLSKAEHAAARAALMSLAPNGVEDDESAYKNLLQELAQKECYPLPSYTTMVSGEAHRPTFVSTVDVEGELFTGQEARTKKQAELIAAKVAYTALKQRTADIVSCDPPVVSPGLESSSIVNTISSSPDPSKTSLPESGLSSSLSLPHSSINSAATIEHAVGMNISDHNKVIVHPRGTKMTYPRGSIVLSISNGEWVAVQAPQSSK